ncbi:hypothetical protein K474DRAFT_1663375 [Panus rudis PR-1116 ss-1]|nr:hypothetical protein K474DRAFT_1663375 [Panus rudis PR-1116 ss-1]
MAPTTRSATSSTQDKYLKPLVNAAPPPNNEYLVEEYEVDEEGNYLRDERGVRIKKTKWLDPPQPTRPNLTDSLPVLDIQPAGVKRKIPKSTGKGKGRSRKKYKSAEEVTPSDGEGADGAEPEPAPTPTVALPPPVPEEERTFLPAELTFSFEEAKQHLISQDKRFEALFSRLKCKPFERLERVDPFSTLASSILGQQISWKAARAIKHRFVRIFFPQLPEKVDDITNELANYFPTAHQVATQDVASLKAAGLSQRKSEYVLDLAQRFADGRLSNEKLLQADDIELYKMLTAVRGIGPWTVDMFALFSLRRPNILPVGDLGVQRGVLRWTLALHDPKFKIKISPDKLPTANTEKEKTDEQDSSQASQTSTSAPVESGGTTGGEPEQEQEQDVSAIPPAPVLPPTPALTQSAKKGKAKASAKTKAKTKGKGKARALAKVEEEDEEHASGEEDNSDVEMEVAADPNIIPPLDGPIPEHLELPSGLRLSMLKNRLNDRVGKSKLLTDKEMDELTRPWVPYRSLGVYYMWALDTVS